MFPMREHIHVIHEHIFPRREHIHVIHGHMFPMREHIHVIHGRMFSMREHIHVIHGRMFSMREHIHVSHGHMFPTRERIHRAPQCNPARRPLAHAHWKLYPPILPSTSRISPQSERFGAMRERIVRTSTSVSGTPPAVTSA